MPRPPPRRIESEEDDDETTEVRPQRRATPRPTQAAEPLKGFAWFLAVATLLVGSCGGLASGFEAIGHGSGKEFTQAIKSGQSSISYVVPTQDNTAATVGVAFRLLFALGCFAAAVFAGMAFGSSGLRAALAYTAAGLAAMRLVIAGIDWILVEQAVELARAADRKSAGYSYADTAAGMSAAEDFGTSAMLIIGMAVVIYWAITSVVFWPTKASQESAVDRML